MGFAMTRYDPESINNMAEMLAGLLKQRLSGDKNIRDIEREILQLLPIIEKEGMKILLEEKGKDQEK
jgi:hypothetical protein